MLKPALNRNFALLLLLASACATGAEEDETFGSFSTSPTTFSDEMDDMDGPETGEAEGDGDGDGDGDPATTGDGDGDGDPTTTGDGDGDPTTTGDGDGDPTTTGDGDGDPPPVCGDGNVDPGETCDSNNFDGETCQSLGFDSGTLGCLACAIDTSGCMNAGNGQPPTGNLYSHCLLPAECIGQDACATVSMQGEMDPYDGYCTNFCANNAECAANLGGTAVPMCNTEAMPYCELECSGGKTCPTGMMCISLQGGKYRCF
jgi:hypothetical protein